MKVFDIEKPYTWLQWPVTLRMCPELKLHVTAKFFGNAEIDAEVARRLLPKYTHIPIGSAIEWHPVMFGDLFHVLELRKYPTIMMGVHQAFDLVKDQFQPWRPHITVPAWVWNEVKESNKTAQDEIVRFGELELYLGGE